MSTRPLAFTLIVALSLVVCSSALAHGKDAGRSVYSTEGECDGLPRINLQVASGFCLALAAEHLGTPRGVLPLANGKILIADMGGWPRGQGRLLELTRNGDVYESKVLLTGLNRPHGLQLGPDGTVYLGEDSQISSIDLTSETPALVPIIKGLPSSGRHPLKSFVFDSKGALFVNRGAPSDNCESAINPELPVDASCTEADGAGEEGTIWKYHLEEGHWVGAVFARGLRNSMALAINPGDGSLWQGENSRDGLEAKLGKKGHSAELPHDELNHIKQDVHYGWPYCYDNGIASPEFPEADCAKFSRPVRLLPPHAAPLGMVFYGAPEAPDEWRDTLILAYHGYNEHGHRIVGYSVNPIDGIPARKAVPLVEGWGAIPGKQPMGAPTDIKADKDGVLWVTEDRNGTLLALIPTRTREKTTSP